MQDPPSPASAVPHFFRRHEAAAYVQAAYGFPCSRQWLAKLAVIGGGPVFHKAGRTPIYAPADLDAWALARIGAPQRSTSDRPSARAEG
ncbi:hypothetical protein [Ancylobacter terrae]|uniref:hypothetical protein n=1 Tax=Ancylobacter sp. sgz301288 TaxID=3342077 RepID=UPI003857F62D